ncbi:hypothetical protein Tco_0241784 [Tanacetum coccineum]
METKDTLSSCSNSEEQQMQQIQDKAKESCMSIDKRALHKRKYDSRVNERQMQTTDEKVDTSKALDASLVDTKSSGTESVEQDTSSRLGNDTHADDANIKPIYDEEPMAEVQLIADHNVFSIGQQHTEQPEFNNESEVDQNAEQYKGNDQGLENQSNTSRDESSRSRNECNEKSTSSDDTDIRPSYDTEPMVEADRNVTPDSPDICDNEIQTDHNALECDDEHVALANLIANLKLDIDENKTIQKQLKKANTSLTQELKECKYTLAETSMTLGGDV